MEAKHEKIMQATFWIVLASVVAASVSVPLSVVNSIENNVPIIEEVLEDDDSTTQTLERLSSAATCLVAGVEYTHGQQIYRRDPCEFCLCLDGEMFCWWQDCPPTLEGPCRERRAFSPCLNGAQLALQQNERHSKPVTTSSSPANPSTQPPPSPSESVAQTFPSDSTVDSSSSSEATEFEFAENATTVAAPPPKSCVVMGREYQIGAQLPHDTGNCVECICGPGAQIQCSPHQCAPLGDDINDYRPPGPRQPDVF